MKKLLLLSAILCCILTTKYAQAQTQVTFYTNMGKFVVEMYDAQRPITTKNFLDLVKKKFYDKIIFHRVIDNFMIQGGDPTGTGSGGSGVTIKDELSAPNKNVQKTISMANSGPNTGQSQFFISLVDNAHLDTKHPVFGIVISNFSVVQAIGKVKTNSSNKPLTPVVMDSVRITSVPTALNELLNDAAAFEIYPNPATPESTILIDATTEKTVGISIYNQLGQVMSNQQKKLITGTNTMSLKEIQTADFSPGVYYLTVTHGSFVSRKKFVVID